jgi:LacI family transcriptional regulator, galactose operon repressor
MVTIKDVAREAEVSVGTASQALRGSSVVREITRRRVLAVATRLRYQPSALARGLVTRRTHTVGLLISDITNPFFIRAVRAVEDVAQENGYNSWNSATGGLPSSTGCWCVRRDSRG